MNEIITGNILDIEEGIICHQVNCKLVADAGLAKQIANKYPGWLKYYKNTYYCHVGSFNTYRVSKKLCIVNFFSQDGFGRDKRYTNYAALGYCLLYASYNQPDYISEGVGENIYLPYGIGCGLDSGGDWNIVSQLIYDALPNAILVAK